MGIMPKLIATFSKAVGGSSDWNRKTRQVTAIRP
jgi:hypothetical protein